VAGNGIAFAGSLLAEEARVVDAEVLARFVGGREDGRPAFTVSNRGSGSAYYVATVPDDDGAGHVLRTLFAAAGVEPVLPGLPPTVEAIRRGRLLTVINHGTEAVDVEVRGEDALGGGAVDGVVLQPFGYALVLMEG
jgi:beta-galactosidase